MSNSIQKKRINCKPRSFSKIPKISSSHVSMQSVCPTHQNQWRLPSALLWQNWTQRMTSKRVLNCKQHPGHTTFFCFNVIFSPSSRSKMYISSALSYACTSWKVGPRGGKNCRKAGAGVYRCSRVKRPSFVFTKHHPKKLFIAPCFIFYIFYVSILFIMYLHNPKLYVVSYPIKSVEL